MSCWKSHNDLKSHVFQAIKEVGGSLSKKHGQHFLVNANILNFHVNKANIQDTDTILEIGAGTGNLTICLSKLAKKVYTIEQDLRYVRFLSNYFSTFSNVEIIEGDAINVEWPSFNRCVSNLPYQISSPVTFKLFDHEFDAATLMFQKEFAQRMEAKAGSSNYSRLSLMTKFYSEIEYLRTVPRNAFLPRPRIDSAIVKIIPKSVANDVNKEDFGFFVTTLFTLKRKTVRSVVNNLLKNSSKEGIYPEDNVMDRLIFPKRRIFTLTHQETLRLYNNLKKSIGEKNWSNIISLNTN